MSMFYIHPEPDEASFLQDFYNDLMKSFMSPGQMRPDVLSFIRKSFKDAPLHIDAVKEILQSDAEIFSSATEDFIRFETAEAFAAMRFIIKPMQLLLYEVLGFPMFDDEDVYKKLGEKQEEYLKDVLYGRLPQQGKRLMHLFSIRNYAREEIAQDPRNDLSKATPLQLQERAGLKFALDKFAGLFDEYILNSGKELNPLAGMHPSRRLFENRLRPKRLDS